MKRFPWLPCMIVGRPFWQQDFFSTNPLCWNMHRIAALMPTVIRVTVVCSSHCCFDQHWLLLHTRRVVGWELTNRETIVNRSSVLIKHDCIYMTRAFYPHSAICNHYSTQMSKTAQRNSNSFNSGRAFCRYLGPYCIQSYKELIGKIGYQGIN